MNDLKAIQLNHLLLSLGNVVELKRTLSAAAVQKDILKFENYFKPYNPRKPGHNRYGLSITSLDGGFSGKPDLDSLTEYNKENNTRWNEDDFRKKTPFFEKCQALKEITAPWTQSMCRSHVLRLNKGGFFPFHRDSIYPTPQNFRLLIALAHPNHFVFLLENKRIFFEPGRLYFLNTRLIHSLFSYQNKTDFLVFNIDLQEESAAAVLKNANFI